MKSSRVFQKIDIENTTMTKWYAPDWGVEWIFEIFVRSIFLYLIFADKVQ